MTDASTAPPAAAAPPTAARTDDAPAAPPAPAEPTTDTGSHHTQSRLFGRGLLYVVVWGLQLVASSLVSPILVHVMAPAQFGALASAIALFQLLIVFAVIGLDQATVLQHSEDGNDRRSRSLLAVAILITLAATAIAFATAPFWEDAFGFTGAHDIVRIVVLWTAPSAIVQVGLALLLAQDKLAVFATISIVSAVGAPVLGLVLMELNGGGATTYAIGALICQSLAAIVTLAVTRPSFRGIGDGPLIRRAMMFGVPLAFGNVAYFVLNAGDRIIIQRLIGQVEVGRYQVAYVVGSVVILLLTYTGAAWTPHFAALRDDAARWALAMRSRDQLYRLLIPIIIALTLVSPFALPILAPARMHPEALTVVVFLVALTAFPVAASGATGRLLVVERRSTTLGVIAMIGAALNVGLNFAFVPWLGISGAAIATVLSYALVAFLQIRALPRDQRWHGPDWRLVVGIAAGVAFAAATMLLPQTTEWNLIRVAAALACIPWFFNRLRAARAKPSRGRGRRRSSTRGSSTRARRSAR